MCVSWNPLRSWLVFEQTSWICLIDGAFDASDQLLVARFRTERESVNAAAFTGLTTAAQIWAALPLRISGVAGQAYR